MNRKEYLRLISGAYGQTEAKTLYQIDLNEESRAKARIFFAEQNIDMAHMEAKIKRSKVRKLYSAVAKEQEIGNIVGSWKGTFDDLTYAVEPRHVIPEKAVDRHMPRILRMVEESNVYMAKAATDKIRYEEESKKVQNYEAPDQKAYEKSFQPKSPWQHVKDFVVDTVHATRSTFSQFTQGIRELQYSIPLLFSSNKATMKETGQYFWDKVHNLNTKKDMLLGFDMYTTKHE